MTEYLLSVSHSRHEPPSPGISDGEFDEILQRNKTVSSSAISRAVQDASAGTSLNLVHGFYSKASAQIFDRN